VLFSCFSFTARLFETFSCFRCANDSVGKIFAPRSIYSEMLIDTFTRADIASGEIIRSWSENIDLKSEITGSIVWGIPWHPRNTLSFLSVFPIVHTEGRFADAEFLASRLIFPVTAITGRP